MSRRNGLIGAAAIAAAVVVVALLLSSSRSPAPRQATGAAYVRINQVGYPVAADKRVYLMARPPERGATFTVFDERGQVVSSAPVGPDLGRWNAAFPHVYALDLPRVTSPGTYTVQVSGPMPATSPAIHVGPGATLYAQPISNALRFYRAQRDGPHFVGSALRTAPGHLNDRHAMTYLTPRVDSEGSFRGDLAPLGTRIDASGGWWDAGDYLKFVHTTAYTEAVLLAGVRDFPAQMGAGASAGDFTSETKFGARWLLRMWDDRTRTLYYQVGIGTGNANTAGDHDIWRLPQADDGYGGTAPLYRYIRHRPVFRAGPSGSPISPNLAGRDAAALALCYQVFSHGHSGFAGRCLISAEHIFALADTSPRGHLLTAIPFDFYPEAEWRDDLELGATELALALAEPGRLPPGLPHADPRYYLAQAAHWARSYIDGPNDAADTLNLYDVSGLAHYELYRAIGKLGRGARLEVTRAGLLADMRKALDRAVARGRSDPFGFGFGWAQYDTTTHGSGLSVMASEYDQVTGTSRYGAESTRWLGNILGANAWGSSFIVGDGRTYPHCLQHQVANLAGSLDGTSPKLAGAAVEGPNSSATSGRLPRMRPCPADGIDRFARFNSKAVYRDNVESYSTVEPAIDLTATSPLAFARQAAGLF